MRDAVQETLTRAVEAVRAARVPEDAALGAFVYGIARHVIADVLRRRSRSAVASVDPTALAARDPSPLDLLISAEERSALARALGELPRADQQLLRSCFVDGERIAQVAARMGQPAERLRQRKSRALKRLREILNRSRHVWPRPPTKPS